MTLGPVIVSVDGKILSDLEIHILQHDLIGGVILFAENFDHPHQLGDLVQSIKEIKSPELIVCVDQEGGRVQRFKEGFYVLPSFSELGKIYDRSKKKGLRAAFIAAKITALELLNVGVDFSFSPVIDLNHGLSEVIGDRSFHSNPEVVSQLSASYIKGLQSVGMKAVAKHFPGHGGVTLDSHIGKPTDHRSLDELDQDLEPFLTLFKKGLPAVMTAHISFPKIDSSMVTFSEFWLQNLLRQKFDFQGLVFSDDLSMGATEEVGVIEKRINLAISSGCDFVLSCHLQGEVIAILESLRIKTKNAEHKLATMRPSGDFVCRVEIISELSMELDDLLNNPIKI